MKYHLLALTAGIIIDLIIGDPYFMPHPVKMMGSLIAYLDKTLLGENQDDMSVGKQKRRGLILVFVLLMLTLIITLTVIGLTYYVNLYAGIITEAILSAYALAAKSLKVESMKVKCALDSGSIIEARNAVSMIVGRDTDNLDEAGVARAAVETVAENTADGVIAPLLYLAIGGPVLGLAYKAINTMDSMVGYHSKRYENFGYFAAKLDDIAGYIPARVCAICMIASTLFLGREYSTKNAYKIFRRDRYKHKSPNSAQSESVMAGSLGLRLAGDGVYFGVKVKKDTIGDELRGITSDDIKRANKLMYMTAFLCYFICAIVMLIIMLV